MIANVWTLSVKNVINLAHAEQKSPRPIVWEENP